MVSSGRNWALVLAAGAGSRLRALTTDTHGNSIPKQFCSLGGRVSLLQLALHRAKRAVHPSRVTTIVAAQHERWWRGALTALPPQNAIVQPDNRGTAIGVLLPLLHILARDPEARIVLLPSDHFVGDESILARAIDRAMVEVARHPRRLVLLGIAPDEPDSELGWIVPGESAHGTDEVSDVLRFVEKPEPSLAAELIRQGGVWNSFILAVSGRTLLELYEQRMPEVVAALSTALSGSHGASRRPDLLDRVYRDLGTHDFSRDLLEGLEDRLSVLPVPRCGWSDLGTPARVKRCLDSRSTPSIPTSRRPGTGLLDLAEVGRLH